MSVLNPTYDVDVPTVSDWARVVIAFGADIGLVPGVPSGIEKWRLELADLIGKSPCTNPADIPMTIWQCICKNFNAIFSGHMTPIGHANGSIIYNIFYDELKQNIGKVIVQYHDIRHYPKIIDLSHICTTTHYEQSFE